ncbi:RepB family plasmid replication initiator protein [Vibrio parahaemolyticus]|uniref:RepB family plasmid replication initiator protein n=1 Tax=Vibrio parahaemolyticus TaxID=670 RepID=UPI0011EEA5C4|nr:RepB family plasmid replication initiator protein [Vibrio parahaemolyticus]KAB5597899.1 RepB family plasmid replication initiator protein [Vibrio parahaemolyticus]
MKKTSKDIVIRQANALTTAAYSLTRNEKRIVYTALNEIINHHVKSNEFGQYPIEINHSEYAKFFNDDSSNVSRDILTASKSLNKKEVTFFIPEEDSGNEKALDAMSWTTKRSHRPKRGTTTIFFNAELVEIITKVDKNFTRYLMGEAGRLNNPYAMRLFESLKQWPNRQSVTFSISWMIERYELPSSYERMSDFRRRFLKPAVQEINDYTSMTLEYDEIADKSRSNRIASIKFSYSIRDSLTSSPSPSEKITIEETLENAISTYYEIVDSKRLPSSAELANLKNFIGQIALSNIEVAPDFFEKFKEATLLAQNLDKP